MLVKLSVSAVARYGKLWTGTQLSPAWEDPQNSLWDGEKAIPNIVDAFIIERACECGRSTRKFRAHPVHQSDEARQALDMHSIPECFITSGGVGSIQVDGSISQGVLVHNWAGRVGGHVILNPVMVLSGYVSREDLPTAKPGYGWACTYSGSTLSEYVLLPVTVEGREEPLGWGLPIVRRQGVCPPCRERAEAATPAVIAARVDAGKIALPDGFEPIRLAESGGYTLNREWDSERGYRYRAGCRDFNSVEALAHWGEEETQRRCANLSKDSANFERARVFREAILADLKLFDV